MDRLEGIFLAEGFSRLTTNELCRRLWCSKSTLYGVARTREQLNQAVVRHFFARSTAEIEALVAQEPDPASRIRVYLSGVGAAMNRNPADFYVATVEYGPTAAIYAMNARAAARKVQAMIEDGAFRTADAALAGLTVAHLMDGAQCGEVLEATGLTADQAFAELGEVLIHDLSVR